jgi:hypothetical protein
VVDVGLAAGHGLLHRGRIRAIAPKILRCSELRIVRCGSISETGIPTTLSFRTIAPAADDRDI